MDRTNGERSKECNFVAIAKALLAREEGQGMTEYAMAVALIAFGCIAGQAAIATSVNHIFIALGTTIVNGVTQ